MPFQRLVKEVCQGINKELRFQSTTLLVLQEAAEDYLLKMFDQVNVCAIHAAPLMGMVTHHPYNVKGYDSTPCGIGVPKHPLMERGVTAPLVGKAYHSTPTMAMGMTTPL